MVASNRYASDGDTSMLMDLALRAAQSPKIMQQLKRIQRQSQRGNRVMQYELDKNQRLDQKTGRQVVIMEKEAPEHSWSDAVISARKRCRKGQVEYDMVDDCLVFGYGKTPLTETHNVCFKLTVSTLLGLEMHPERTMGMPTFNVLLVLGEGVIRPRSLLFMTRLGENIQSKLLNADEFILVYLDLDLLKKFFASHGFNLNIRNMRAVDQEHRSHLTTQLFGDNKLPYITRADSNDGEPYVLLDGLWGRVIFDFMRPLELIDCLNAKAKA